MNRHLKFLFKGDKVIWMILFLFCMISIVEVFSASSLLTYKSHNYFDPISYHSCTIIVGVFVAIIIQNIPYPFFRLAIPFFAIILYILLIMGVNSRDKSR